MFSRSWISILCSNSTHWVTDDSIYNTIYKQKAGLIFFTPVRPKFAACLWFYNAKNFVWIQHPKTKFTQVLLFVYVWSTFKAFCKVFWSPWGYCNKIHVKKSCSCQITNFSWSSTLLVSRCSNSSSIGLFVRGSTVSSGRTMSSCEPLVSCIRRVWFTVLWYCNSLTSSVSFLKCWRISLWKS